MRKWIIAAFLIAAIAGCASTEDDAHDGRQGRDRHRRQDGRGARRPAPRHPACAGSGRVTGVATGSGGGMPASGAASDPRNILSKRNIYFDYDQFTSRTSTGPSSKRTPSICRRNRSARAILQGHTDERGTREYNIALGQKRADAVKNLMLLLGARKSRSRR